MSLSSDVSKSLLVLLPDKYDQNLISNIRFQLFRKGFVVVREETRGLNAEAAEKIAADTGKSAALVGMAYLFVVARDDATVALNDLVSQSPGLSDVAFVAAKQQTAANGIRYLFPRMIVDPIPSNGEARDYVQSELKPLLVEGLTEVAKAKPDNAVEFFARYLLEHNPNKPPVS